MKKLNFGCGDRYACDWVNIDFHSQNQSVGQVNILGGFPYPDSSFDAVYSSHVLEHFTRNQTKSVLLDAWRILKPEGILRTTLPDLEGSCLEYLRVLSLPDEDPKKESLYSWIIIEVLDQMVRSQPRGLMGEYFDSLSATKKPWLMDYLKSRTESKLHFATKPATPSRKLPRLTIQKLRTKALYFYIRCVGHLLPAGLRDVIMVRTGIGERHRWMYDRYGLGLLMKECGFSQISFLTHDQSSIPGFNNNHLDTDEDGTPYKNNSVYCEAVKPGKSN